MWNVRFHRASFLIITSGLCIWNKQCLFPLARETFSLFCSSSLQLEGDAMFLNMQETGLDYGANDQVSFSFMFKSFHAPFVFVELSNQRGQEKVIRCVMEIANQKRQWKSKATRHVMACRLVFFFFCPATSWFLPPIPSTFVPRWRPHPTISKTWGKMYCLHFFFNVLVYSFLLWRTAVLHAHRSAIQSEVGKHRRTWDCVLQSAKHFFWKLFSNVLYIYYFLTRLPK